MNTAIIHGFILALGLILPLGVQNVFVFNQGAVQPRFARALPIVITAALCDSFLILAAVYGVSMIVLGSYLIKTILLGIGLVFLIYMGFVTWRSAPERNGEKAEPLSWKKQVVLAMSVSLLNPHAILDTVGVIGTNSLQYAGMEKAAFAAASILVSWLWFTGLALSGRMTGRLDKSGKLIGILNKISAVVMWITAVYMGMSFGRH